VVGEPSLAYSGQCSASVDQGVKHLGAIIGGAIGGGVALLLGVLMFIKRKKTSNFDGVVIIPPPLVRTASAPMNPDFTREDVE
jgi:hypothetical protein